MASEIIQIINRGDATFSFKYGGQPFTLPPDGVPRAIPVEAIKTVVGDWDARDRTHDMKRMQWRKMLNVRYGLFNAPWYTDTPARTIGIEGMIPPEPVEDYPVAPDALVEGRWKYMHPNLPRLEVRSFEDNSRIYTILDDPDGDLVNGQLQAQHDDASTEALLTALKRRDEQIDGLMLALAQTNPEVAAKIAAERNTPGVPLDPAGAAIHDPLAPTPDDATTSDNAMDVMNEALGHVAKDADDTPARPVKKAAAKKAAAVPDVGDDL